MLFKSCASTTSWNSNSPNTQPCGSLCNFFSFFSKRVECNKILGWNPVRFHSGQLAAIEGIVWLFDRSQQINKSCLQRLKVAWGKCFIHIICRVQGKRCRDPLSFSRCVHEAEQKDGSKCSRSLPSIQIPPGVGGSERSLTGSSKASSKEPVASGESSVVTWGTEKRQEEGWEQGVTNQYKMGQQILFKLSSQQTV